MHHNHGDWAVPLRLSYTASKSVVVVVVVVVVSVSALCVCISTSHAHATESKAIYYHLHAKPGDEGQLDPKILPDPNPVTQRRPISTMMTPMQNMRATNRTPISLRNPHSLPNSRTRRNTPEITKSCKVCWCFSVESNSFKAPRTRLSQETPARPAELENDTRSKDLITNNTISNQLRNMTPVRKPPGGKLTSKPGRTITKGQNPSQ